MDFNPYDETSSHLDYLPPSASIDLYEPTSNYLPNYMDLLMHEPPTYGGETSNHPINPRCSSANSPPSSIDLNEPTGETNRSSSANRLLPYIDLYEPYANGETSGLERSSLPNSLPYVGSPERIQHGMTFDPTDKSSSLPRSSSASSLPSVGSFEQSIYFDAQLPELFDLEKNYQPLPSCGVEYRPTIRREAPFDGEEFYGCNQNSMLPVLGPTGETNWEAIQRLDREFLHQRRTFLEAMQQSRDVKFRFQMLENGMVDLLVKIKDLEIRKNHSELDGRYLQTTSNRVIEQLNDKVVRLEFIIIQRDLYWFTIRMDDINFQMANLEAKFTKLKDEVSQLNVQFSNQRTEVTRITSVNKLKGAIDDFNVCRTGMKQNMDQLISEICNFSDTVEVMETSNTATKLMMKTINNLQMQIIHLIGRASALENGLVPLEKILEVEQNKANRESTRTTTGEHFAQLYLKRVL